jgi:hypothetical protein
MSGKQSQRQSNKVDGAPSALSCTEMTIFGSRCKICTKWPRSAKGSVCQKPTLITIPDCSGNVPRSIPGGQRQEKSSKDGGTQNARGYTLAIASASQSRMCTNWQQNAVEVVFRRPTRMQAPSSNGAAATVTRGGQCQTAFNEAVGAPVAVSLERGSRRYRRCAHPPTRTTSPSQGASATMNFENASSSGSCSLTVRTTPKRKTEFFSR